MDPFWFKRAFNNDECNDSAIDIIHTTLLDSLDWPVKLAYLLGIDCFVVDLNHI